MPGEGSPVGRGSGSLGRPQKVKNWSSDKILITRIICTHSAVMLSSSLRPTNFRHITTTSSIAGLFLGSSCQHVSRSFHISYVSPISRALPGISGLAPRRIRSNTVPFFCSSNGFLPVKTSTATIAKEYTSPDFDSITGTPSPL